MSRFAKAIRRAWRVIQSATQVFSDIDGEQRAAAFAYYAFFSVFPLLLLLVSAGSLFADQSTAARAVISYIDTYLPLSAEERGAVFKTVRGVIENRGAAGVLALAILLWSALRLFNALVRALNRAWRADTYNWWQLPLRGLSLIGILAVSVLLGVFAPTVLRSLRHWLLPDHILFSLGLRIALLLVPVLILFIGLTLFYKLAPRRQLHLSEVWLPALISTVLLQACQGLFVIYVKNFANFNALYGTLGGLMILLMWIYLAGMIIIFGGCLCAASGERRNS